MQRESSVEAMVDHAQPAIEVTHWQVIEVEDTEVDPTVLQVLYHDTLVNILRGQWDDLLVRHGDDGEWCTENDDEQVLKELDRFRETAQISDTAVFYLLIKQTGVYNG